VYDSRKVFKILSGISKEDAKVLGFTKSRPVNLMIETLAVAPPQIRPSIEMNPEKRAEDDITSAYVRVVSLNNELIKNKVESSEKAQRIEELERIVASIMVKLERVRM
jgi:DNA-directed RNA polymerase II subunit RPB1